MVLSLPMAASQGKCPREGPLSATDILREPLMPEGPEQMGWTGHRRKRMNSSGCTTGRLGLARTDKHTVTAFCVDA